DPLFQSFHPLSFHLLALVCLPLPCIHFSHPYLFFLSILFLPWPHALTSLFLFSSPGGTSLQRRKAWFSTRRARTASGRGRPSATRSELRVEGPAAEARVGLVGGVADRRLADLASSRGTSGLAAAWRPRGPRHLQPGGAMRPGPAAAQSTSPMAPLAEAGPAAPPESRPTVARRLWLAGRDDGAALPGGAAAQPRTTGRRGGALRRCRKETAAGPNGEDGEAVGPVIRVSIGWNGRCLCPCLKSYLQHRVSYPRC
ncbi:unnamed protein product, partial [Urochloa humidicola]